MGFLLGSILRVLISLIRAAVTGLGRIGASFGRLGRARSYEKRGGGDWSFGSEGGGVDIGFRVKGLAELNRAFEGVSRDIQQELRKELAEAAEDIAVEARGKLARYPGASLGTIGPRASRIGFFVTQRKRTVTGQHPEFGSLQMGILGAAASRQEDQVVRNLERAIDRIARRHGF